MRSCECFAETIDPGRADMWKHIFPPYGHVPIVSPVPAGRADLAGVEDLYYLIDLARVSDEQRAVMIRELCAKFNLKPFELLQDIQERGIPVKAGGTIVSWCPLHCRIIS